MEKKKEDRRIRITKQAIRESLIELMQQYPIARISVKMLCESADINRSTFYAHYRDQYDLLKSIQQDVITDIKEQVYLKEFFHGSETAVFVLAQMLVYGKENAEMLKAVLNENGDPAFQNELMQLVQDKIMLEFHGDKSLDQHTLRYLKRFILAGLLSMTRHWLDENCDDDPDMLANLMVKLIVRGTSGL